MHLCNIRASTGNFVQINSRGELASANALPAQSTDLLLYNATRPHASVPRNKDLVQLVSPTTNMVCRSSNFLDLVQRWLSEEVVRKNQALASISSTSRQYIEFIHVTPPTLDPHLELQIISPPPASGSLRPGFREFLEFNLWVTIRMNMQIRTRQRPQNPSGGSIGGTDPIVNVINETRVVTLPLIFDAASGTYIIYPNYRHGTVRVFSAEESNRMRMQCIFQNHRVNIKCSNGKFLAAEENGTTLASRDEPFAWEEFSLFKWDDPFAEFLSGGDSVVIRSWHGRFLGCITTPAGQELRSNLTGPTIFTLEKIDGSTTQLKHGDGVRLRVNVLDFSALGGLGGFRDREEGETPPPALFLQTRERGIVGTATAPGSPNTAFQINYYKKLKLLWHGGGADNFSYGSVEGSSLREAGYEAVREQAYICVGPRPGTAALKSFFNAVVHDRCSTATTFGETRLRTIPFNLASVHVFQRIEGYVFESSQPYSVPLRTYFSRERQDHMLAALPIDEASAASAGYVYSHLEGHGMDLQKITASEYFSRGPANLSDHIGPLLGGTSGVADLAFEGRLERLFPPIPSTPRTIKALVLSGGGAKGCFEVGAIKRLWENGYRPDIICGVSVGSVNAIKLAEMRNDSADELVRLWRAFSSRPGRIYRSNHYIKVLEKLLDRIGGAAADTGIATGIGAGVGMALLGPIGLVAGATAGFFAGKDLSRLEEKTLRLLNTFLTMMHAQHSMEPLRQRLREEVRFDRLLEASHRVQLRLGITDLKSGQFLSVTGPDDTMPSHLGRVEVEPDHQMGHNWLTRPIMGTSGYVMDLRSAVYASSALPVFMEPLIFDFTRLATIQDRLGKNRTVLEAALPKGLQELIAITNVLSDRGDDYLRLHDENLWRTIDARITEIVNTFQYGEDYNRLLNEYSKDGKRGFESSSATLYDGGLRDTLPIRTAMRLGATEIMCITGDQLQRFEYGFSEPTQTGPSDIFGLMGGSAFKNINLGNTPAAKHFLGLLGIWFNDVSRTDMLLSVGQNEYLGWLNKAFRHLNETDRRRILSEIDRYNQTTGIDRYHALGTTGILGGNPENLQPYGQAAIKESVKISLIAPDREILGPLEFEDHVAIEEGMHLGYTLAQNPIVLSK